MKPHWKDAKNAKDNVPYIVELLWGQIVTGYKSKDRWYIRLNANAVTERADDTNPVINFIELPEHHWHYSAKNMEMQISEYEHEEKEGDSDD